MLILQNDTFQILCRHAASQYPEECCGILLGVRKNEERLVCDVSPSENTVSMQSRTRFQIHPLTVLDAEKKAERQGWEIIGFYHSHPDHPARPSEEDVMHMIKGYLYPIISVQNGDAVHIRCFQKLRQSDTAPQEILIKEK